MASASNVRAGGAFVEFFGKDDKLQATLKNVSASVGKFGKSLAISGAAVLGAGSAVLTPLLGAAGLFMKTGGEIDDLSQRSGIAVEQLSTLGYAAQQNGASLESLSKGVIKMQQGLADAANGSESARSKLESLGLSVEGLLAQSPDEQFRTIAEALSRITDPAQRTAAAMDLFGKSGVELIPMLAGGREGIEELEQRARSLGLVMSGESASAAAQLGDLYDDLWSVVKQGTYEIGAALAPTLIDLARITLRVGSTTMEWIRANRATIVSVAAVASGVVAAGSSLIGLGGILKAVSMVMSGLAPIIGMAKVVLLALFSPVAAIAAVLGAVKVAFLAILSPVGLAVAAVAALIYYSGVGGKALEWLREQFGPLSEVATRVFGAMRTALTAGNWEAAADVMWASLNKVWLKGVTALNSLWRSLSGDVVETWYGTVDALGDSWAGLMAWIDSTLNRSQNSMARWIISAQKLAGVLSEAEAQGALSELDSMRTEHQDRVEADLNRGRKSTEDAAEKRREAARVEAAKADRDANEQIHQATKELEEAIAEANKATPIVGPEPGKPSRSSFDLSGVDVGFLETRREVNQTTSYGSFGGMGGRSLFGGKSVEERIDKSNDLLGKIAANTEAKPSFAEVTA